MLKLADPITFCFLSVCGPGGPSEAVGGRGTFGVDVRSERSEDLEYAFLRGKGEQYQQHHSTHQSQCHSRLEQ